MPPHSIPRKLLNFSPEPSQARSKSSTSSGECGFSCLGKGDFLGSTQPGGKACSRSISADMILLWHPLTYRRSPHYQSHRLWSIRMHCPNKRSSYFLYNRIYPLYGSPLIPGSYRLAVLRARITTVIPSRSRTFFSKSFIFTIASTKGRACLICGVSPCKIIHRRTTSTMTETC